MRQIARAIAYSFFEDFKHYSTRKKAAIVACIVVFLLFVWSLLRSGGRDQGLATDGLGLSPLSMTDHAGAEWTLDLITGQPLARIRDNGNEPGQPLLIRVDVRRVSPYEVSLGLTIEGQAGERYMAGALKNGQRQPEPRFSIVHERGRVLATGRFKYG